MQRTTRNCGPCAFHIFHIAEWLAPSLGRCDVRAFSASAWNFRGFKEHPRSRRERYPSALADHRAKNRENIKSSYPDSASKLASLRQTKGTRYTLLQKVILENFDVVLQSPIPESWGIKSKEDQDQLTKLFREDLEDCFAKANNDIDNAENNGLFHRLKIAFIKDELRGLKHELRYAMMAKNLERKAAASINTQMKLGDLQYPLEWYPATRAIQRHIHLHVGPTNSGKTYHALKRLEEAETGIYAGPLRLLAHEVYSRFNAKGKVCSLVTGEERRIPEGQKNMMSSCTVEMVPLNTQVDVAVIDEIQMIGDKNRGWAWTQALLGVQAKEVHLCGELRTIPLIEDLCTAMGDKLTIHRYERLSPLTAAKKSLNNDLTKLEKGDCIILFSRLKIHAMKHEIEKVTKRRCAVVYGSLPPETRATQAALFNDPNNDYDFLVASDAVGMGLNLSIKRVIFESVAKINNTGWGKLEISDIKQIGGRAGRFKTAAQAVVDAAAEKDGQDVPASLQKVKGAKQKNKVDPTTGIVTTLDREDLKLVQQSMKAEAPPLKTAGIFPPDSVLMRFASYYPPGTPFSYVILRLHEIAKLHPRFHMCLFNEQIQVADLIQPYDLTIPDRIIFLAAPVQLREKGFAAIVQALARCVADQSGGALLDINEIDLELLEQDKDTFPGGKKNYLQRLEVLHKALTLYLWLSYRFAGVFTSQALGFHVKGLVEEKIDQCLADTAFTDLQKMRAERRRTQKTLWKLEQEEKEKARMLEELKAEQEAEEHPTELASGNEEDLPDEIQMLETEEEEPEVEKEYHQAGSVIPPSLDVEVQQQVTTPPQVDA